MTEEALRTLTVGGAEVVVLRDEDAVSRETSARTVAALKAALEQRGTAHIALTGGSSAVSLYRVMARHPWRDAIPWSDVHFWWGDDRFVPRDHPESNASLAYSILFEAAAHSGESGTGAYGVDVDAGIVPGLVIDVDKVHPIETEEAIARGLGPSWAALAYKVDIEGMIPAGADGLPVFDVFLLGVGSDGHTLSIFPESPGLADDAPLVMGVPAPDHIEPKLPRVTLAPRVLRAAGAVFVMSAGQSKADVIAAILNGPRDPARLPAQTAILPNATWLLDEAAATGVTGD
jgi:6-phosphogluconolactonase